MPRQGQQVKEPEMQQQDDPGESDCADDGRSIGRQEANSSPQDARSEERMTQRDRPFAQGNARGQDGWSTKLVRIQSDPAEQICELFSGADVCKLCRAARPGEPF